MSLQIFIKEDRVSKLSVGIPLSEFLACFSPGDSRLSRLVMETGVADGCLAPGVESCETTGRGVLKGLLSLCLAF